MATPNMQETGELEQQLARLEQQLFQHYCEVGKSLLETAERENRRAGSMVDDIVELRRRIALSKHCLRCPACTAVNDPDSRYCKSCGTRLDTVDPVDSV